MLAAAVDHSTAVVLIDIAVIVVVARLMGVLFTKLRQPAVVGEIIAGVLLGPSLLGAFPGNLPAHLFPTTARPSLHVLAEIGVVLFMFIVGLEADLDLIKGRARLAVSVSLSSIVVPFGLGIAAALLLHRTYGTVAGEAVDFWPFALFIGASMSVTAFPVLARILTERGMHRTTLGSLSLACAAVDDVAAWSLLAVVVAIVEATGLLDLPRILISGALFVALLLVVVRPLLAKLAERWARRPRLGAEALAFVLAGLLVSAWATDRIGIHAIFGAFLFGAIMPKKTAAALVQEVIERIESITVLLLLPIFFIVTGLDVNVRELGLTGIGDLVVILAAAIGGKFAGAALAARAQGVPARRSMALATLMNTRGLTELVILNVGLTLGVLDEKLFTLLVLMAVITTVMTEPLLRLVYPDAMLRADLADAERSSLGSAAPGYRVLLLLADPADGPAFIDLAADLAGPGGLVEPAHFLPRGSSPRLDAGVAAELARMAGTVDRLAGLARHRSEIDVRPHAQFSTDLVADVVSEVQRSSVDAVVIAWQPGAFDATLPALVAAVPAHVVLAAGGEHGDGSRPVRVQTGDGASPETALELGARMALARAARSGGADPAAGALQLLADPADVGRAQRLAERIARLDLPGVAVTVGPADARPASTGTPSAGPAPTGLVSAGDVLLVGLGDDPIERSSEKLDELLGVGASTVVAVRSADDPRRVGLEERMGRLRRAAAAVPRRSPVTDTPGAGSVTPAGSPAEGRPEVSPTAVPTESP